MFSDSATSVMENQENLKEEDISISPDQSNKPAPFVRLSKQEKKARKLEARAKKIAEKRPLERALKKEKKRAKYLAMKKNEENGIPTPLENIPTRKRKRNWDEVQMSGHTMVIDLEFDEHMSGAVRIFLIISHL